MVNLSAGIRPTRRSFDDFSCIDEMESLFLKPGININRMLTSHFDDGEDIVLPTRGAHLPEPRTAKSDGSMALELSNLHPNPGNTFNFTKEQICM
jgi:hypothetical protein